MKKLLSTILIISLIVTTPIFADNSVNADASQNSVTAPSKVSPQKDFSVTANGFNQSSTGTYDGEIRYTPSYFIIKGPDGYEKAVYFQGAPYTSTLSLKAPGQYKITATFKNERFQQIGTWISGGADDAKTKTITVKRPKYKVTLNANKGTVNSKSKIKKKVTYYKKYGKLKKPTRKNYKFKGWYTKKSGGTKIKASNKVKKVKAHTLYAHWEKVKTEKKSSNSSSKTSTKKSDSSGGKYVYITRTGSKYHRGSCHYLRSSKIKVTRSEAKARGCSPCSVCKP